MVARSHGPLESHPECDVLRERRSSSVRGCIRFARLLADFSAPGALTTPLGTLLRIRWADVRPGVFGEVVSRETRVVVEPLEMTVCACRCGLDKLDHRPVIELVEMTSRTPCRSSSLSR